MTSLRDADFRRLLEFRDGLRRFMRWSEDQAVVAGLTPAPHPLLLAVRGHAGPDHPTISDVADHLLLRHHSVVGLVNRAENAGLVTRTVDRRDQRVVRLALTDAGERILAELTAAHLEELRRLTPALQTLWSGLDPPFRPA